MSENDTRLFTKMRKEFQEWEKKLNESTVKSKYGIGGVQACCEDGIVGASMGELCGGSYQAQLSCTSCVAAN